MTLAGEMGLEIVATCPDDLLKARSDVGWWLQGASLAELTDALGKRYLVSTTRKQGVKDMQAQIAITASRLTRLPGDVALDLIAKWRGKYFPTEAELVEAIEGDTRTIKRRMLFKIITEAIENGTIKPIKRITPQQAEKIAQSHGVAF